MSVKVNHKQLGEHIWKAFKTGVSLHITGRPGIGKSDRANQTAREIAESLKMEFLEAGWHKDKFGFIDIRLSQMNPEDLKGLPMFNQAEKWTEWLFPDILPRAGKGIIFFDELNLAPPSIQAAAYQLILDKRLGTYKVPDGWCIIAAGNGTEDRANVYELPAPLANRFSHVELMPPSIEDWTEYATPIIRNPSILAYLNFKPSHLYKFDSNSSDVSFPTPRSIMFGDKLIEGETSEETIIRMFGSCVGEGVAREFVAFNKMYSKLDIDRMIKNPNEFKNPTEIDVAYAIAGGLAERYNKEPKNLPNICKIWLKMKPEFVVISMKLSKAYRPKQFNNEMIKLKEWDTISKEYAKYLM